MVVTAVCRPLKCRSGSTVLAWENRSREPCVSSPWTDRRTNRGSHTCKPFGTGARVLVLKTRGNSGISQYIAAREESERPVQSPMIVLQNDRGAFMRSKDARAHTHTRTPKRHNIRTHSAWERPLDCDRRQSHPRHRMWSCSVPTRRRPAPNVALRCAYCARTVHWQECAYGPRVMCAVHTRHAHWIGHRRDMCASWARCGVP